MSDTQPAEGIQEQPAPTEPVTQQSTGEPISPDAPAEKTYTDGVDTDGSATGATATPAPAGDGSHPANIEVDVDVAAPVPQGEQPAGSAPESAPTDAQDQAPETD